MESEMATFIFHTKTPLTEEQLKIVGDFFMVPQTVNERMKPVRNHFRLVVPSNESFAKASLQSLAKQLSIDVNLLPSSFDSKKVKLVLSDMDSTLIAIECVDEIADFMQVKSEVADITEAAMRGEIGFEESLRRRVGLLRGLETAALQRVFDERVKLNPGAEEWVAGLKAKGIKFALVSGGFTFFTDKLGKNLGLDYTRANVLEEVDGKLTGSVVGEIVGAQAKADFLHELCQSLGVKPSQVVAAGDGANDLLMMKEAGLSVGYHAKPKVQEEAAACLNFSGLDAILDFIDEE